MQIHGISLVHLIATVCFALAVIHTFSVKFFQKQAHKYKEGSIGENAFHFLGEVEVVFGLWAAVFFILYAFSGTYLTAVHYVENSKFTEPILVFILMTICSTKPILRFAGGFIELCSKFMPFSVSAKKFYFAVLFFGPLLGSFITEPAAMTVVAYILLDRFYSCNISSKLKYATLGLLFVNISIGGTLTHYAAPPVLMVAGQWGWDTIYMLTHFGWRSALAMALSTLVVIYMFRKEFETMKFSGSKDKSKEIWIPKGLIIIHLLFLALIILNHHYVSLMVGIFLFFLGLVKVTEEYQDPINLKSPMLVAFFLGGLVVLGGMQAWWLEQVITRLDSLALFLGASALTAIADNAAITFLGAQVEGLSESAKYALVSGAVAGGGLTVIANAPNPAGYSILNSAFGKEGISALGLFKAALPPTLIAMVCFWFL